MNKIVIDRIISKLKEEVCPIHNKSAKFEGKKGIIVISEHCCSDFYTHLTKIAEEELDRLAFKI